jgi:hypothetical protein
MLGFYPGIYWKICWDFITPVICLGVWIFSLVSYSRAKYGDYEFPLWGELVGWALALSSILCIPVYAIYYLITSKEVTKQLTNKDLNCVFFNFFLFISKFKENNLSKY